MILSSGYSQRDAAAGLLDQRLAAFVGKPFRWRFLELTLKEILG